MTIGGQHIQNIKEVWGKQPNNPWFFVEENAMTFPKINKDHPVIQSFFAEWSDSRIEAFSNFLVQSFPVKELSELYESSDGAILSDNKEKINRLFDKLVIELQASMSAKDAKNLLMSMDPFKSTFQND